MIEGNTIRNSERGAGAAAASVSGLGGSLGARSSIADGLVESFIAWLWRRIHAVQTAVAIAISICSKPEPTVADLIAKKLRLTDASVRIEGHCGET
jgi:hypothetical protein